MRTLLVLVGALGLALSPVLAKGTKIRTKSPKFSSSVVHVKEGHHRDGRPAAAPHIRTTPNRTRTDNYSAKGNVNPQTGKVGTRDPYKKTTRK